MLLSQAFQKLLESYPAARKMPLKDHGVASLICKKIPDLLKPHIDDYQRYILQGSAGQGQWANVPWVAVFDRFITESAQEKFYIVYLVDEEYSKIFLSLNQGVTSIKKLHGDSQKSARAALKIQAQELLSRLGKLPEDVTRGEIDLKVKNHNLNHSLYQAGSICSKEYHKGALPNDQSLAQDLLQFIQYYRTLATKELIPTTQTDGEPDEAGLENENLIQLREHKRIDRNQSLAKKVKKIHGYTCQACKFNFEKKYGPLGEKFIEAHHLQPLHQHKGKIIKLDPKTDFAVLCSNCHRMIHRFDPCHDIEAFRQKYWI